MALSAVCCIGLCACKPGVVFHAFHPVPATGWERNTPLHFSLVLPDSTASYALSVELRHHLNFPYTDLPVNITLATVSDSVILHDTLCIPVADKRGNRTGIGWGDLYITASSPLTLPAGWNDTLRLTLRPALKDSILPGVNDIGVCIEKK